jgi:hypothetical protein
VSSPRQPRSYDGLYMTSTNHRKYQSLYTMKNYDTISSIIIKLYNVEDCSLDGFLTRTLSRGYQARRAVPALAPVFEAPAQPSAVGRLCRATLERPRRGEYAQRRGQTGAQGGPARMPSRSRKVGPQ